MITLLKATSSAIIIFLASCTNYKDRKYTIKTSDKNNCKIEIISTLETDKQDNIQILKCSDDTSIKNMNEALDDSCKEFFFDVYDIDEGGYVKKTGVMCYEEGIGWEIIYQV